ncbi:MAG: hypothetical protein HC819_20250 [Cyclobacteriaceae bacterium]|nr:hypothetical protein [Cyclobacteriaceae bacterium]
MESYQFLSYKALAIALGTTVVLFAISALKILSGFGFTIFQVRIQKTMFFAAFVALLIFMLYSSKDGYSIVMFFPWVAFFLSHFFLSIRHRVKRELSFMIYFVTVLGLFFGTAFQAFNLEKIMGLESLLLNGQVTAADYTDRKILVLGPNIRPYAAGMQATPYFDWELSKMQLNKLEYYDNLQQIDKNLRSDTPDVIIDQVGMAPKLFEAVPLFGAEYVDTGQGVYKRKESASN